MLFEFVVVFLSEIIFYLNDKIMKKLKTNRKAIMEWILKGSLMITEGFIGTLTGGLPIPTDSLIPESE